MDGKLQVREVFATPLGAVAVVLFVGSFMIGTIVLAIVTLAAIALDRVKV
jgi:hypothetical protein